MFSARGRRGGACSEPGMATCDTRENYSPTRTTLVRRHRNARMSTPPRTAIEYVGHGTVVIDLDGVRLMTDPLLRNRVTHLRRAVKVDARSLRGIDAVLISHLHYDHLDMPSLQRLGREMPVVAPHGSGKLIARGAGVKNVLELRPGEEIRIGSATVRATRADHDSARLPFGAQAEPLGYVVEGGGRSVYFAGDTDVFGEMAELAPIDVALLPIWGWGPTMGPGHMDPERAAEAAALLGARLAIPIHWGTYYPIHLGVRGPPGFLSTPPGLFEDAVRRRSPATTVKVLQPGERTDV